MEISPVETFGKEGKALVTKFVIPREAAAKKAAVKKAVKQKK